MLPNKCWKTVLNQPTNQCFTLLFQLRHAIQGHIDAEAERKKKGGKHQTVNYDSEDDLVNDPAQLEVVYPKKEDGYTLVNRFKNGRLDNREESDSDTDTEDQSRVWWVVVVCVFWGEGNGLCDFVCLSVVIFLSFQRVGVGLDRRSCFKFSFYI